MFALHQNVFGKITGEHRQMSEIALRPLKFQLCGSQVPCSQDVLWIWGELSPVKHWMKCAHNWSWNWGKLPQLLLELRIADWWLHLLLTAKGFSLAMRLHLSWFKWDKVQSWVHERVVGGVAVNHALWHDPSGAGSVSQVTAAFAPANHKIPRISLWSQFIHLTPHSAEQYWRQLGL